MVISLLKMNSCSASVRKLIKKRCIVFTILPKNFYYTCITVMQTTNLLTANPHSFPYSVFGQAFPSVNISSWVAYIVWFNNQFPVDCNQPYEWILFCILSVFGAQPNWLNLTFTSNLSGTLTNTTFCDKPLLVVFKREKLEMPR